MNQTAGTAIEPTRPLETIAAAALRVNTAVVNIQEFLDRCHGLPPEAGCEADAPPPPSSYINSLDRLFEALGRLESRIEDLIQLG